ncbi:hypothetical protein ACLSZU_10750, partial [Avibacterium avium]
MPDNSAVWFQNNQLQWFFAFFAIFLQKGVAKIFQKPIIRRTQRRDVVEIERYTSRRCFLLFNNQSDNLCGH